MYKDKDKQREANRTASQRRRDKQKGMTLEGMTIQDEFPHVIPEDILDNCRKRLKKRGKDIKCFLDLPADVQQTIYRLCPCVVEDHEERCRRTAIAINYQHLFPDSYEPGSSADFTKLMAQAGPGHVRVSKPGDADYVPQCETTRAFVEGRA